MKKLLTIALSLAMILSLAACGGNNTNAVAPSSAPASTASYSDEHLALAKEFSTMIDDYNKTVDRVNESPEMLSDEELVTTMNSISAALSEVDQTFTDPSLFTAEYMTSMQALIDQAYEFINISESAMNEIDAAKATAEAAQADAVIVPVELINLTGTDLHALALSPANDEAWGENLISEVIKDGDRVLCEMPFTEGTLVWDILVQDGSGNQLSFLGVDFSEANSEGAKLVLEATEGGDYYATIS